MRQSDWDPLSDVSRDRPEVMTAELRNKCPVAYSDAFGGFWALSKYEDIEFAAKHPEVFSIEKQFIIPPLDTGGVRWKPQQSDPPEHAKYRSLLQPFFARPRVRGFEAKMRELAIEAIESSGRPRQADLCPMMTRPFTGSVLCMFLGFPDRDWHQLEAWTEEMLNAATAGDQEGLRAVIDAQAGYVRDLREERRARPLPVDEDLMSAVLAARIDGEPISEVDIEGTFKQLMGAGHETSAGALGSFLRHLAENPEDQERLRREPSLIPAAVEESLRLWGSVFGLVRTTRRDVEIRGTTIPAGEVVALLWTSAGRDEDVHDDADRFRLDRGSSRHLSFGAGIHRCPGNDLARQTMRLATEELLARTRSFSLAGSPRRPGWPAVGTSALPVAIEWAASAGREGSRSDLAQI